MPSSEGEYNSSSEFDSNDSYYSDGDLEGKVFGRDSKSKQEKIYCAICAGKHSEKHCPNKTWTKSDSFNGIRKNLAKQASYENEKFKFKQVGEPYDRRYDEDNNSSPHYR